MSRGKLFSIKSRLSSINSIFDLSKAMGLVASSKFSFLQSSLETATYYGQELDEVISKIAYPNKENKNFIFIIVASDKGLCGSYNNNVVRFFKEYYAKREKTFSKNSKILVIGKKIASPLKKIFDISSIYSSLEDIIDLSSKLSKEVLADATKSSELIMVYTNYKTSRLDVKAEKLFPELKKDDGEFIFEPNKEELFQKIFPMYLKFKIYRNILSALISEHYSRMLAMRSASDNAEDLMKNLKRFYNKERQSIITQEILEVVSGSENFDEI